MGDDDAPLMEWHGDAIPDLGEPEALASNDAWVFEQTDRLVNRLPQRKGKDRRTEGEVFDQPTLMVLHKLLAGGVLRSLDFPVSTGKEANVFRGTTPQGGYVAVKIYRVNTATFKHVLGYIQGDERFQGVAGDKRGLVEAWAQKEFRNLLRMRDAGMDVPEAIKVVRNVLLTEYIGEEAGPWPKLKDFVFESQEEVQTFYDKLVEDLDKMIHKAGLVHGDLSEYNILVDHADDSTRMVPRIIDVGQAVLKSHPMVQEYLERDLVNFTKFFKRKGARVDEEGLRARLVVE